MGSLRRFLLLLGRYQIVRVGTVQRLSTNIQNQEVARLLGSPAWLLQQTGNVLQSPMRLCVLPHHGSLSGPKAIIPVSNGAVLLPPPLPLLKWLAAYSIEKTVSI
jgi:hypothetical protein